MASEHFNSLGMAIVGGMGGCRHRREAVARQQVPKGGRSRHPILASVLERKSVSVAAARVLHVNLTSLLSIHRI